MGCRYGKPLCDNCSEIDSIGGKTTVLCIGCFKKPLENRHREDIVAMCIFKRTKVKGDRKPTIVLQTVSILTAMEAVSIARTLLEATEKCEVGIEPTRLD